MSEDFAATVETGLIVEKVFRVVDARIRLDLRQRNASRRIREVPLWYHRDVKVVYQGNGCFVVDLKGRCAIPRKRKLFNNSPFPEQCDVRFRIYVRKVRGTVTSGKIIGVMRPTLCHPDEPSIRLLRHIK